MSIYVVAALTAKPGCAEKLRSVGKEDLPFTRGVAGCLAHDFYESADDGSFLYLEQWESIEAYDAHLGGPAVARWSERTNGLLASISIDIIYPDRVERL